jgi:hypothetical protein
MADYCSGCDHDSAFGDDDFSWATDAMFPTQAVAGTKRDADSLADDAARLLAGPSLSSEYQIGCSEPCSSAACDIRPAKRKASTAAYHHPTTESHQSIEPDCQFPDDCFEKFCQECNSEPTCPRDCSVPCPDDDCPEDDACFDPRCTQKNEHCTDGCVDPECTKAAHPDHPCFCQKCDTQPCPLGDPNNECHFAHSAPTPVGTIYCYDNAPCHFQEGLHGHDHGLASFETYPCFSQSHGYNTIADDLITTASSAPTPALSHSNYTSLESAFTNEPSPAPGQAGFPPNCFLNVSGDHCHIDNSCCHGPQRACGEAPSASQQQLDLWNSSIAPGNGLATNFMNFGFNLSLPTSPMSADRTSMASNPFSLDNPMISFNDQSWMLTDSAFPNTFDTPQFGATKLDYLAAAVQTDILRPGTTACIGSSAMIGAAGYPDAQACVCKWYVGSEYFAKLCISIPQIYLAAKCSWMFHNFPEDPDYLSQEHVC